MGYWCPFIISQLAHVSLSVSPFFSPLSLRHGFVVVCFEVTTCYALTAAPCDLGDPGWGIPGFRMVLCCFAHPEVWPCDFVVLPFVSAAIPCQDDTMLSLLH